MFNPLNITLGVKTSQNLSLGFFLGIALGIIYFLIGSKFSFVTVPVMGSVLLVISALYGVYSKNLVNIFLCAFGAIGGFFIGIIVLPVIFFFFVMSKAIITGK